MDLWQIIITVITFIVFYVIHKVTKNKRPFAQTILSMAIGPFILVLMYFIGTYFSVLIPLSKFSIIFSMIFGIPGITTILLLNLLL